MKWNSLPNSVVTAQKVKTFGNRLDKHWKEHPMIYDFKIWHMTPWSEVAH